VREFTGRFPEAEIEVFEDNTSKIEARLLEDKTDIGLVEGDINSPEIVSAPFMTDELRLICSPRHRFAPLDSVPAAELAGESFIIREEGSGTRRTFEDEMASHGLRWRAAWVCNNADTIKAAVAQGLGVSVISARAAAGEIARGELAAKEVEGIKFMRRFKTAYHRNKFLTPQMRDLIAMTASLGAEM
jgi:DNA-binding transcriptional LysR family regulator